MEIVKNQPAQTEGEESFPKMNFNETPVWKKDEKFEITGEEFEALFNFFNIFTPAINIVNRIFHDGLQSGKITPKYTYPDGTEVPEKDVAEFREKVEKFFQAKMAKQESRVITDIKK